MERKLGSRNRIVNGDVKALNHQHDKRKVGETPMTAGSTNEWARASNQRTTQASALHWGVVMAMQVQAGPNLATYTHGAKLRYKRQDCLRSAAGETAAQGRVPLLKLLTPPGTEECQGSKRQHFLRS